MHSLILIVYSSICSLPGGVAHSCYVQKAFATPRQACKFTKAVVGDWSAFKITEHSITSSPTIKPIELVCAK